MPQFHEFKGALGTVTFAQVEDPFNGQIICTLTGSKASGERMSATWRISMPHYLEIVARQRINRMDWKQVLRALVDRAWSFKDEPQPARSYVYGFNTGSTWFTSSGT